MFKLYCGNKFSKAVLVLSCSHPFLYRIHNVLVMMIQIIFLALEWHLWSGKLKVQ